MRTLGQVRWVVAVWPRAAAWVWVAVSAWCVVAGAEERHQGMATAVRSINESALRQYVEVLSNDTFEGRAAGSRGGRAAAGYLITALQRLQLQPAGTSPGSYVQTFGNQYQNLLAQYEGSDPQLKNEYVLIGAHYDHVGYGNRQNSNGPVGYIHNGADDNSSGVAALLEIAQALARLEPRPRRSVLIAFWDCEENELYGSSYWVQHPTVERSRITTALNLDMVGRLQNRLELIGTRSAAGLRRLTTEQNIENQVAIDYVWEIKRNSDHYSFFAQGIPVLMFHTGLHNDYHRPSDDAEKLNYPGLRAITALALGTLVELANQPQRPQFREASRLEGPTAQGRFERVLPPPPSRLGVTWSNDDRGGAGLLVTRVEQRSPAEAAGLRAGDRLVEFGGTRLTSRTDLRPLVLAAHSPVAAVVRRASVAEPLELSIALADEPVRVGVSWREDEADPGALVIVQVVPGSPADRAGLRPLDRITLIDGRTFVGGDGFLAAILDRTDKLLLTVARAGQVFDAQLDLTVPGLEQSSAKSAEN